MKKIEDEIIKPRDRLIDKLRKENVSLHGILSKQVNLVAEVEEFQKEKNKIITDNEELHKENDQLKTEYDNKVAELEKDYQNKQDKMEQHYIDVIDNLDRENSRLHKVVDQFKKTITLFVNWISNKLQLESPHNMVESFEKEHNMLLNAERQVEIDEQAEDEEEEEEEY